MNHDQVINVFEIPSYTGWFLVSQPGSMTYKKDGLWHLLGLVAFMRRFLLSSFFCDQQLCLLVEDKIFHMLQLHVGSVRVLHDILPDSARYRNSVAESSLT